MTVWGILLIPIFYLEAEIAILFRGKQSGTSCPQISTMLFIATDRTVKSCTKGKDGPTPTTFMG